jgi:MHS family proline/betaine transporter-like MFS transporter
MITAAADGPTVSRAQYRKAITAGVIGNVLEWYDFGVYGYLVPTISQLFFPSGDPVVSLLSTFAVFGVGFVMRPVGSILFGIYGDRHGRRRALSAVVFVMAVATFAMGLLPTYGQVGVHEEAWATLYSAVSRPFEKPETRRIAVKVINHYGDEVLKVYSVI